MPRHSWGVRIHRSTRGPSRQPSTVTRTPSTRDREKPVCRALSTAFLSLAPQNWDRITVAPELSPTKKPLIIFTRGPVVPTAARAWVLTNRPTMTVSTVLYICWKKVPSRIGKKNKRICFQMTPSVICRDAA